MLFVQTVNNLPLMPVTCFSYYINLPTILISVGNCLYPDNIYLFKVNKTTFIYSKSIMEALRQYVKFARNQ